MEGTRRDHARRAIHCGVVVLLGFFLCPALVAQPAVSGEADPRALEARLPHTHGICPDSLRDHYDQAQEEGG